MKKYTSWIIIIGLVVIIFGGIVWYASGPGKHDEFAICINDSGAKFYGAFWCPHCQSQKAMFGKSARLLPYVECSTPNGKDRLDICVDNNIDTYPTWHFPDNSIMTGVLSFAELSDATGCAITEAQN